ncbi:hypothetical protein N9R03_00195 [bacterium]|nr:hypothetical protein [bacterium]
MSEQYKPPQDHGYHQHTHVVVQNPPSNPLGMIGFVTSLVSLVMCGGLLFPISFTCSLIGMFRQPAAFAIAGFVVSLVTGFQFLLVMVFFIIPFFFVGAAAMGVGVAGASALGTEMQIANEAGLVENKIRAFYIENDRIPSEVECNELLLDEDEAEMMNATKVSETEMLIKHQGADGIFGTVDDREFSVDLDLENPFTELDEISFD